MDGDADIGLFVDRLNGDEWESELVIMSAEDLVIGSTYAAFQVPSERSFNDEDE